jgi:hypothetical protein
LRLTRGAAQNLAQVLNGLRALRTDARRKITRDDQVKLARRFFERSSFSDEDVSTVLTILNSPHPRKVRASLRARACGRARLRPWGPRGLA